MRFVPYYTVSYHGRYYRAGVEFEIDDCDAELMSKHGDVVAVEPSEKVEPNQTVNTTPDMEKPVKKAGRPRKTQ